MVRVQMLRSGGVLLEQVGVSICVLKVSENCVKVESSSEGAVLFHIVWVVVRGIGVCGAGAVMGEIAGVRAGVLVSNLRGWGVLW